MKFIAPAQTVCNYGAILTKNLYGVVSDGNDLGAWQRFIVFDVPKGPNSEGSPSSRDRQRRRATARTSCTRTSYPNTAAPGQVRECEAGNEPFIAGRTVIGNVPGNQGINTRDQSKEQLKGKLMALLRRKTAGPRDPSRPAPDPRIYGRHYTGPSPWVVGLFVAVLIAIGVYLAFAKKIPFTSEGFQLHATFENAATLRPTSPVRIAGVNVGKVTGHRARRRRGERHLLRRRRGPADPRRTRQVDIRPRLFLEGNFFLDLDPGSPSSPVLADGDTIPVTQTATAVQIDEVLAALQAPARKGLQRALSGFGTALNYQPTAAADVGQDPDVQGKTAGEALQQALRYGGPGRARHRDRQRGAARPGPARPLRPDRCQPPGVRQARGPRDPAQGPDHQLQRVHRRPRGGVGEPQRDDPRARADCGAGAPVARRRSPTRCRRSARWRSS